MLTDGMGGLGGKGSHIHSIGKSMVAEEDRLDRPCGVVAVLAEVKVGQRTVFS
jgi:hypothetical protein